MAQLKAPTRMRDTIKAIGRRVRDHRLALDLSQSDLGRKARVSPKFVGEFERGTVNCSLVTLLYITEGLDCTLTQLIQDASADSYVLTVEQMQRMKEAVAVLGEVTTPRRRARRR